MTIDERILSVLKTTFELEAVDTTCCQKTCEKWDSMGQLNLVVELETEFGVSFEPEEIGVMISFDAVKCVIMSKMNNI